MNAITRNLAIVVACLVVISLAVTLSVIKAEASSDAVSYVTVVVSEDNSDPDNASTTFAISWNHVETCSSSYNAYLRVESRDTSRGGARSVERTLLGTTTSSITQIDRTLSDVPDGSNYEVEVFCAAFNEETNATPIASAPIANLYSGLVAGTYSSSPLTSLTVSHGTLSPTFSRGVFDYTVADVANENAQITLVATTTADSEYEIVFIGNYGFTLGICVVSPWGGADNCSFGYSGDILADSDSESSGFQVDLVEGKNRLAIHVYHDDIGGIGQVYNLTIDRARSFAISGITETSYAENGTDAVATYSVSGADDSATTTLSLSGDDSDDLSISDAGVLSFVSSPDYESPADANTDNVYEVTVEASSGDMTATLDVQVTVTNVNESPVLSGD